MNNLPYIPGKTRAELATPAPNGGRHTQIVKVVASLVGQGFNADAIFAQARAMYDATVTDREIAGVIQWATRQSFMPCAPSSQYRHAITPKPRTPMAVIDPAIAIDKFLAGDNTNDCDLWHVSPWRPLEDWRIDAIMFIAGMFHAGELVNIITDYTVNEHGKANPSGFGVTLDRDAMMRHLRDNGTLQSRAGAWLRPNPIDGNKVNAVNKDGTPSKGWTDNNVTAFRFALLEIDTVPIEKQISVFAKLPLPINCIMLSGGKSCHAWVRIDAPDAASYRATVNEMLDVLRPLGVDQSNKNPSRLSRLPGAQREIGAQGNGQQRLLYLAPDRRDSIPIFPVNQ